MDTADVVTNGGAVLHGLDPNHGGVVFSSESRSLRVESLDAGLVAPGYVRNTWDYAAYDDSPADPRDGAAYNLHSNLYNTNYVLYYPWLQQDAVSTFRFELKLKSDDAAGAAPCSALTAQRIVYLSSLSGSHSGGDGSLKHPFATLIRARRRVRELLATAGDVCVLMRRGSYAINATVELLPQDGGGANRTVTYASYPDERAVLEGGRTISGWKMEPTTGIRPPNECQPTKGCNVCAKCCQDYVLDGSPCYRCVQEKCEAKPAVVWSAPLAPTSAFMPRQIWVGTDRVNEIGLVAAGSVFGPSTLLNATDTIQTAYGSVTNNSTLLSAVKGAVHAPVRDVDFISPRTSVQWVEDRLRVAEWKVPANGSLAIYMQQHGWSRRHLTTSQADSGQGASQSEMAGNYVGHARHKWSFIYHDEGCSTWWTHRNVVDQPKSELPPICRGLWSCNEMPGHFDFLAAWASSEHNISFPDLWTRDLNQSIVLGCMPILNATCGNNITTRDITVLKAGAAWPAAAQAVIDCTGAPVKTDDVSFNTCPPERLLWNGLCRPAEGWGVIGWSKQELLDRHVTVPRYLSKEHKPAAINISNGRQLFVDSFLIDANRSSNVHTAYHSAEYANETVNPVLAASEPWEMADASMGSGGYGGFASPFSGGAWYNPAEQRYEMYYRCGAGATCVAWSNDTLTWKKPLVRRRQASKMLPSNILVEARYDGVTVWLDLDTQNASRRYVLASGGNSYDIYTSANGLDFKNESSSGPIQDRSSVFKNALTNTWVFSIKGTDTADPGGTRLGRMRKFREASDVMDVHWKGGSGHGAPVNWLSADVADDPNVACAQENHSEVQVAQIYNVDAVAYESVVVGLFSIITGKHCNPAKPFMRGGEQDAVYLGFSRDGFNFFRSPVRSEAFLPMSEDVNTWNFQNVQSVGGGFLTHNNTLQFYVGARSGNCTGGASCKDGQFNGNATGGTALLRRDGFASVASQDAASPAMLTTEVLRFDAPASHFFLNAAINSTGSLLVELLSHEVVVKTSIKLSGILDSTATHVLWTDHVGLEKHAGQPVRFRFTLSHAALFSFWVSESGEGCSGGPVAAGSRDFGGSRDVCKSDDASTTPRWPRWCLRSAQGFRVLGF